ncbi:Excinuclease ABC subunit A [Chlamydia abortus]|nr:Excinuclease ABC subunit A [Chlamydia abortus]
MYILSPVVINQKGSHQILLAKIKRDGFLRVKINGEIFLLDKDIRLDKNKK